MKTFSFKMLKAKRNLSKQHYKNQQIKDMLQFRNKDDLLLTIALFPPMLRNSHKDGCFPFPVLNLLFLQPQQVEVRELAEIILGFVF